MQYCPFCGQRNALSALSCLRCGELQPQSGVSGGGRAPAPTPNRPGLSVPRGAFRDPRAPSTTSSSSSSGIWGPAEVGLAPVRRSNHGSTRFLDPRSFEKELQQSQLSSPRLQGRVKLIVEQGLIIGEQYLLTEQELYIGRHDPGSGYCPDIELSAQDPSFVHRSHAKLWFTPNGDALSIKDLGGRNGVFVNNQSLGSFGETTLNVGDRIRIGRVALKLLLASDLEIDGRS